MKKVIPTKIIRFCYRCGREYQPAGNIEYGKFYPAFIIKEKIGDIFKKRKIEASREVKKAFCVECSKEIYDKKIN